MMTLIEILSDIHAVNKALAEFEKEYGVLSETFYAWYQQGNEPEEQTWVLDFAEWAGLYKSHQRLLERYQNQFAALATSEHDDVNRIIQRTRELAIA